MGDPALTDLADGRGVEVMELLAAAADGGDQVGRFQDGEVLAHRLPGHVQSGAELAEGLAVARVEAVEELPATRVGQRLEDLVHLLICSHQAAYNRQPEGCMSIRVSRGSAGRADGAARGRRGCRSRRSSRLVR